MDSYMSTVSYSHFYRLLICLCISVCNIDLSAQQLPDEVEIEVSFSNVPLDSALLLLVSSSHVNISWDESVIPPDVYRSLHIQDVKLGLALDDVLYDTGLKYKIVGSQLVIVKRDPIAAAAYVRVSGYVSDATADERLVYATINDDSFRHNVITNEYGYYSLKIPVGAQRLHYSYIGYEKAYREVNLVSDTVIHVGLTPDNELNEVIVVADIPQQADYSTKYDNMPIQMLNGMSALAGEPDLYRMLHMRSGVTSGADGLGGLNVRGGEVDQNLVLMDGVPIYNTGHALGLFSVFNSSVVKSAQLIKDGFPSRYGGRLSSVLDVRIKEGNKKQIEGDVSVSPLLVRGAVEGPIKKGKSSFLISGRRTIVDPWLKPLSKYTFELDNQEGFVNYHFYDLNAKLNFVIGDRDELYLSGYFGNDRFDNQVAGQTVMTDESISEDYDKSSWDWGNNVGSLRWGHYWNAKLVSYLTLGYSNFYFENFDFDRTIRNKGEDSESLIYGASLFKSDIKDRLAHLDIDYNVSSRYQIHAGVHYVQHEVGPGVITLSTRDDALGSDGDITVGDLSQRLNADINEGTEYRYYIENELKTNGILLNLGAHMSQIVTSGKTYTALQPRASVFFNLSKKNVLKATYSEMNQFFHLLSASGFGLPNDIWIPSTADVAPQQSVEYSLSLKNELSNGLFFNISAYQKNFDQLTNLGEGGFLSINADDLWEETLPVGEGKARGVEVELEKRSGRLKGWLNYTFARSERTFESINEGQPFAARNDRRNSLKVSSTYSINDNVELSGSWQMSDGLPYTSPVGLNPVIVDDQIVYVPIYSTINNIQLPTYHRLDFAINLYTEYDWGNQKLSIGAYNAYNRQNSFYIDIVRDINSQGFKTQAVSVLPIIPFVSLGIAFD